MFVTGLQTNHSFGLIYGIPFTESRSQHSFMRLAKPFSKICQDLMIQTSDMSCFLKASRAKTISNIRLRSEVFDPLEMT